MQPRANSDEIRPLASRDIPALVQMFADKFIDYQHLDKAELERCLRSLTLDHPAREDDIGSLVSAKSDDELTGFIGVLPQRMNFNGQEIRATVAFSFMVADPQANPLAGAKLIRKLFSGPQDVVLSEGSTPESQEPWIRGGAELLPCNSIQWYKPLRHAGSVVSFLENERLPRARMMRPLANGLDKLAAYAHKSAWKPNESAIPPQVEIRRGDRDLFIDSFAACLTDMQISPNTDKQMLRWQLDNLASQNMRGELHNGVLLGRNGTPLGCYLIQARAGERANAIQVIARRKMTGAVLESLFRHADKLGCVMVQGLANPHLMQHLIPRHCRFKSVGGTLAHSRNPAIIDALLKGNALVNGLAGNSWTRLENNRFLLSDRK